MKEIREQGEPDVVLALCGNKLDLAQMRQVDSSEGKDFASKNKLLFSETSAMDDTNVESTFKALLEDIYKKNKEGGEKKESTSTLTVTTGGSEEKETKPGCAC
jgi:GTPase SAR1 family protein